MLEVCSGQALRQQRKGPGSGTKFAAKLVEETCREGSYRVKLGK